MQIRVILVTTVITIGLVTAQNGFSADPKRVRSQIQPSFRPAMPITTNSLPELINKKMFGYRCHNLSTGKPAVCKIEQHTLTGIMGNIVAEDCQIEPNGTITTDTCANGGHTHPDPGDSGFPNRPIILDDADPSVKLTLPGGTNISRFSVKGDFGPDWVVMEIEVPENAGYLQWNSEISPPPSNFQIPNRFVGPGAQPNGNLRTEGAIEISFRELRQLPAMDDLYRRIRGESKATTRLPDDSHFNDVAFAGTEIALEAMRLIAEEFKSKTTNAAAQESELIRPNDMSLPLGGVFDIFDQWRPDHETHRDGLDIDINRSSQVVDSMGQDKQRNEVNCTADINFVEAVNAVLSPVRTITLRPRGQAPRKVQTAVLCESGGKKHIDITTIIAKQTTP